MFIHIVRTDPFVVNGAVYAFRYILDCTGIRKELGWEPERDFAEGLERTVK
jgi:dTDP-D-glucose 4,6-dehydratase